MAIARAQLDPLWRGIYLGGGNIVGVIEHVLHRHTIELKESTLPAQMEEVQGFYNALAVKHAITAFLRYPLARNYAIFSAKDFSFGIMKVDDYTYVFNSHSCTPLGRMSRGSALQGYACLIRWVNNDLTEFGNTTTRQSVSEFICNLNPPTPTKSNKSLDYNANDYFSLCILECNNDDAGDELHLSFGNLSMVCSTDPTANSIVTASDPSASETYPDLRTTPIVHTGTDKAIKLCLEVQTQVVQTESDQLNVPNSIKAIIEYDLKVNLHRETAPPIFVSRESNLEPLSFIKLFPYGVNGFLESREEPYSRITPAAYAKARVMGVDQRFQCTEYLFYVLAMIEQEKISQTYVVTVHLP